MTLTPLPLMTSGRTMRGIIDVSSITLLGKFILVTPNLYLVCCSMHPYIYRLSSLLYSTGLSSMMFVPTADPPQISTQPQDQIEAVGSATFTVQVSGKQPITYRWECKLTGHSEYQLVSIRGTGVCGGDTNTLTIDDIRKDDEGDYRCLIYNSAGKVHSGDAKLILGMLFNAPLHLLSILVIILYWLILNDVRSYS